MLLFEENCFGLMRYDLACGDIYIMIVLLYVRRKRCIILSLKKYIYTYHSAGQLDLNCMIYYALYIFIYDVDPIRLRCGEDFPLQFPTVYN